MHHPIICANFLPQAGFRPYGLHHSAPQSSSAHFLLLYSGTAFEQNVRSHKAASVHPCFFSRDGVKRPLRYPYDGPLKVVRRNAKHFTVDIRRRQGVLSIGRIKPAHLDVFSELPFHLNCFSLLWVFLDVHSINYFLCILIAVQRRAGDFIERSIQWC